jgi:hypothetical protein
MDVTMITLDQLNTVLDEKLDSRFGIMMTMIQSLTETTSDIQHRVIHLEYQMEQVKETLEDLGNAEDKDALATINHERRISRLEKMQNITPKPEKHLRKFS